MLGNVIKFGVLGMVVELVFVLVDYGEVELIVCDYGFGVFELEFVMLFWLFFCGSNVVYVDGFGLGLGIV